MSQPAVERHSMPRRTEVKKIVSVGKNSETISDKMSRNGYSTRRDNDKLYWKTVLNQGLHGQQDDDGELYESASEDSTAESDRLQFESGQEDSGIISGEEWTAPRGQHDGKIASSLRPKARNSSTNYTSLPDISIRPGHVVKRVLQPRSLINTDKGTKLNTENSPRNYPDLETPRVRAASLNRQWKPVGKPESYLQKDKDLYRHEPLPPKLHILKADSKKDAAYEFYLQRDKYLNKVKSTIHKPHVVRAGLQKDAAAKKDVKTEHSERVEKTREKIHCPHCMIKVDLAAFVEKDIIGADMVCPLRYGLTRITYLDYIASGRPLKCFETYIRYHVMPTYANTHTEVNFVAQQTTKFREEARSIIRECVNASDDDAVIFTGSGSTAAINKLIYAMDLGPKLNFLGPTVFVGPYEHHSNILPWRELKAVVITIGQTEDGLIDLDHLEKELQKCRCGPERMLIGSFSAASNVTGILTDVHSISVLMHKYKGVVFFDYACAGPYVEIDMNPTINESMAYKDAVFISPHKFIGGPQTPGILIAKRWMFKNEVPHGVGGGTVSFVRRTAHKYLSQVEHREEGGTPAITESIRAGLAFKLKAAFTPKFIMSREEEMFKLAVGAWSPIEDLLILGNTRVHRLPIFPLLFMNKETGRLIHHDFIAIIFNDLFGIQDLIGMTEKMGARFEKLITEGESSTTEKRESYADETDKKDVQDRPCHNNVDNVIYKPGFVRLSFPYFMSESCFNFVLKAVELTAKNGWSLLPLYDFDKKTGRWWFRKDTEFHHKKSLYDVTFREGRFKLRRPHKVNLPSEKEWTTTKTETSSPLTTLSSAHSSFSGFNYDEILERAELIFKEAQTPQRFDCPDQTGEYTDEAEELRWFMLPSEAADIVNSRPVKYVEPTDLPFLPQALQQRLINQGYLQRRQSEESFSRELSTENVSLSRYSCSCCCCCCSSVSELDKVGLT